jgi:hypothetical protein
MKSKSETGHAVNAGNFSRLVFYAEEAGTKYNPPDQAISIVSLKNKDQKQLTAISDFHVGASPWIKAVNEREQAMKPVNKLMTKVKNLVSVCNVNEQFIKDVTSFVKKIQGVRATPKIKTEPSDPNSPTDESIKQISASQLGIDQKMDHIKGLVELLKVEPNYTPNETELTIGAIETVLNDLRAKNDAVSAAKPVLEFARINRNKEMYTDPGNGADLATKVKKYFKAVYGADSEEYHKVAKLKFRNMVK